MRKTYLQLPSISELELILKIESKRQIPNEKIYLHYASLEPFIDFLKFLKIETKEISLDRTWREVRIISERIINETVNKILNFDLKEIALLSKRIYQYLSKEDTPQKSDLIITFGAKTTARVEKAIELYQNKFAPKLLFSGDSPFYCKSKPEAEVYNKISLAAKVCDKDIIVETKSITLVDNVRSSLNLLDKLKFSYKKIIIVNSPYSQLRGYSYMEKYSPIGTKILRVNCLTRDGLKENDWFTNEEGIRYIMLEFYKIWFGLVLNSN